CAVGDKRQGASDYRNSRILDTFNEVTQLLNVKYWLRDRILRTRLNLVFEATNLLVRIDRAGVDSNTNTKRCRLANGVVADVETMVQLADHIRQTNGVNVKDSGCVRVGTHLWRVAGDQY